MYFFFFFFLKLVVNFIMKYVFINIFIIQREKCENSNALFKHIYQDHSQ